MRISIVLAASLLVACASSKPAGPPPIEVSATGTPGEAAATRYQKITATVQAVDPAARRITLQGQSGTAETIDVPPDVKRFSEISPGDVVELEVQEGLLLQYQPPGTDFVAPAGAVVAGRADKSQPPAAGAAAAVQSTVTVTDIDVKNRIVQFTEPDGTNHQVKAGPQLSIEKLKKGDRLVATYVATAVMTLNKKPKQP